MIGMQAAGGEIATPVEPGVAALGVAAAIGACVASVVVAARVVGRLQRGLPVVTPRPHAPATWSGGDVAAIAAVYVCLLAGAGTFLSESSSLRLHLAADIVTKSVATLAGIGLLRSTGASWATVGLGGDRWREDGALAIGGLGLVLAPLLALAAALDRIVPYEHKVVDFLAEARDPVAVALVVLAAVVVAPVAEEFFFRRVLQGWLEVRLPDGDGAAAVGLSAAAFAVAHVGHGLAPVPLLLLGVVLGAIARATGTLAPCVLLHALFNAVSVGLLLATPVARASGGGG